MSFLGPGPTPDLQGFADRQRYLRTALGRDVRFYGPAEILYDPTIPTSEYDNEGIPLDPLAGASAVASAGVGIDNLTLLATVRANVVFQPLSALRRDAVLTQQEGQRSTLNKDLICDIVDKPLVEPASYYMVGTLTGEEWTPDDGELWKIVQVKTDGFGALQRVLIFGQSTA